MYLAAAPRCRPALPICSHVVTFPTSHPVPLPSHAAGAATGNSSAIRRHCVRLRQSCRRRRTAGPASQRTRSLPARSPAYRRVGL